MSPPTIEVILADPIVGPLVRRYLHGRIEAARAQTDLLNGTIMHVEALDLVHKMEEGGLAKMTEVLREDGPAAAALGSTVASPGAGSRE